ncbi:26S proteasome regulatory subunit 4-like B [Glycine soja]|uniref:26S proteasome regulatory subunit 4-like B n=1 Tax=Glycine soja TaxID=3848 RepID=A0A445GV72_GLYSO|nr:26S proteasome regulatory subunit 4-like B [Glycine soja]
MLLICDHVFVDIQALICRILILYQTKQQGSKIKSKNRKKTLSFMANQERLKPQKEKAKEDRSKVDDLQGSPMSVGNLEELIDESHAIVSSSMGPEYYVGMLSFIDKDQLEPECAILMHNKVGLGEERVWEAYNSISHDFFCKFILMSTNTLPFATMGSGSLAAMSVFESKYKESLSGHKEYLRNHLLLNPHTYVNPKGFDFPKKIGHYGLQEKYIISIDTILIWLHYL